MKSEEEGNPHKPSTQLAKRRITAVGAGPVSMTAGPRQLDVGSYGLALEMAQKKSIVSAAPHDSSSLGDSSERTGGNINNVSEGKRSIG